MISRQFAFGPRAGAFKLLSSRTFCQSAKKWKAGAANVKKSSKQAQFEAAKAKQQVQLKVREYKASNTVAEPAVGKYVYPERILIWHSGAPKAALLGTIKIFSFFVFGAACVFLAPRYIIIEDESNWKAIPAIILGACPMLFMALTSSPWVASVRLQLPPAARISRDALLRFCDKPPMTTPIEFTTSRMNGLYKTTYTTLGEVRPVKNSWGIANLERIVDEDLLQKRTTWGKLSGWMKEPRNKFFVGGEEGVRKAGIPKAWPKILESIQRNANA